MTGQPLSYQPLSLTMLDLQMTMNIIPSSANARSSRYQGNWNFIIVSMLSSSGSLTELDSYLVRASKHPLRLSIHIYEIGDLRVSQIIVDHCKRE